MKKLIAAVLVASLGFGTLAPAAVAKSGEKNAHNLAIGSTAVAAYLLSQKKTRTLGLVAAGGSAYAWKKHHDSVKARHDRAKRLAYYRSHHRASAVRTSRAR